MVEVAEQGSCEGAHDTLSPSFHRPSPPFPGSTRTSSVELEMNRIGVCSWSLQAEDPRVLAERVAEVGVSRVQLGLDPIVQGAWKREAVTAALKDHGIRICSGMMGTKGENYSTLDTIKETGGVRRTEHWEANLGAAHETARVANELDLDLVSFHAGFLPHDAGDPERKLLLERLGTIVDVFAERGVRVAFETGQETAETLLGVLAELDRPTLGVNFDPANMILYAMGDPVEALKTLGERVFQIHIKDATATEVPGTWGAEVPAGSGQVDWKAFFAVVDELQLNCDLMIEREAGEARVADIRTARAMVEELRGEEAGA